VAELALSGALRPVRAILPSALGSLKAQRQLVCSDASGTEAALAGAGNILVASHLLQICEHLQNAGSLNHPEPVREPEQVACGADLRDVRGQQHARRALEISAAGNHSLLLVGPPGTGKTLLASRLPGLLPALGKREALETATVASIYAGGFDLHNWRNRPFRAPHHSASAASLVGGGSDPRPGEISLAHHGVLFLDELPEFKRHVLEALREPLETGSITIARATNHAEFPARFQLIAAMNPCPCGYRGDPDSTCRCSPDQIQRYRSRISGPLLDRIDIQIEMPRIPWQQLENAVGEDSATVRKRVGDARQRQLSRGFLNAQLPLAELDRLCALAEPEKQLLQRVTRRFRLSARSIHRILKVARTIADLDRSNTIQGPHLQEAVGYRCMDKQAVHD
jgi:magnesium chelatase family protein